MELDSKEYKLLKKIAKSKDWYYVAPDTRELIYLQVWKLVEKKHSTDPSGHLVYDDLYKIRHDGIKALQLKRDYDFRWKISIGLSVLASLIAIASVVMQLLK